MVKVVADRVTFQPFPDPVASPISRGTLAVVVWVAPFSVMGVNANDAGVETKASVPADKPSEDTILTTYVNSSPQALGLVPDDVVTYTSTTPDPAGDVTVIDVELE